MNFLIFILAALLMQQSVLCKKNVLFLVSDDMRPQINAYEGPDFPSPIHPKMHTPNLDALAARSLLLTRAYVQQAVSNTCCFYASNSNNDNRASNV